jgi:N,N'-diacetyllegionaminate synthase
MNIKKCYIIAEVGPNHNGSYKLAKKYVKLISKCGANAVKFQLSNPNLALSKDSFPALYEKKSKGFDKNEDLIKVVKKSQLSIEEHLKLSKICKKYKIDYLCSAFDLESLKFLDQKIKIKYFKIPSGEILSIDMLKYINNRKKKILLSTGMATFSEIAFSLKHLSNVKKRVILLHCISNYPTENKDVNLLIMKELKKKFKCEVGFSDHTIGVMASIIAVSMGARVLEKHVTLNKKMRGPDHKNSCTISEFKKIVKKIRDVEIMLGKKTKKISKKELEIAKVARKSIISKYNLFPGMKISNTNICFKRPGTGFLPTQLNKLLNKKIRRFIEKDRVILEKNLN